MNHESMMIDGDGDVDVAEHGERLQRKEDRDGMEG